MGLKEGKKSLIQKIGVVWGGGETLPNKRLALSGMGRLEIKDLQTDLGKAGVR